MLGLRSCHRGLAAMQNLKQEPFCAVCIAIVEDVPGAGFFAQMPHLSDNGLSLDLLRSLLRQGM